MKTITDERGIEYVEDGNLDALPAGWALCGHCGRAWNDAKPTGWTPAPSGRCPFEDQHEDDEPAATAERVPLVVVVRDPDASNDYTTFGGPVETYDIDAGHADLSDPDEYAEWAEGHMDAADEYEQNGHDAAAQYIRQTVASYAPDA